MHKYMKNFICKTHKNGKKFLEEKSIEIAKIKIYNMFTIKRQRSS